MSTPPDTNMPQSARRRFLKALVVAAATTPFTSRIGWLQAAPGGAPAVVAGKRFPQSVASGDPGRTGLLGPGTMKRRRWSLRCRGR